MDTTEHALQIEPTWMQPLLDYIIRKELPQDEAEARRVMRVACDGDRGMLGDPKWKV